MRKNVIIKPLVERAEANAKAYTRWNRGEQQTYAIGYEQGNRDLAMDALILARQRAVGKGRNKTITIDSLRVLLGDLSR